MADFPWSELGLRVPFIALTVLDGLLEGHPVYNLQNPLHLNPKVSFKVVAQWRWSVQEAWAWRVRGRVAAP